MNFFPNMLTLCILSPLFNAKRWACRHFGRSWSWTVGVQPLTRQAWYQQTQPSHYGRTLGPPGKICIGPLSDSPLYQFICQAAWLNAGVAADETDADSGEVVPRCVGSIPTVSLPPFRGQRAIRVFNAQCETVLWHREQTTRAPVNGPRQQFSLPPLATSGTSALGSIMASAVHRVHAHMKASADGAGVA